MNKRKKEALKKAELYLEQYKNHKTIYYKELKKIYKKYKSSKKRKESVNDAYIKHIDTLCEYIQAEKRANYLIPIMSAIIIITILIASFFSYQIFKQSSNTKDTVEKHKKDPKIVLYYKNFNSFNPNIYNKTNNYLNIEPVELSIEAKSEEKEDYKVKYNIYLKETNNNLSIKDNYLYNVKTATYDSGIQSLKNIEIKDNQLLIFSKEILTNQEENVEVRIWLDSDAKVSKNIEFKLNVSGVVV